MATAAADERGVRAGAAGVDADEGVGATFL